jgi:hypothetical protein
MQTEPANWPTDLTVSEPVALVDVGDVGGPRTDVTPDSWSVRREISTYLPEQVRAASGQSVASASAEVGSADVERQAARNPFATASSRVVESACSIRAGFTGTDGRASVVPVFTGRVMEAGSSALDDVLAVDCDDNASLLRRDVIVAPLADQMRYTDSGSSTLLFPGVSGSYVMDSVLRQLGYYTMPALTSWATISVPMQGTLWPESRPAGDLVSATQTVGRLIHARNGGATDIPTFVSRAWETGERFLAWTDLFRAQWQPSSATDVSRVRVHGWCDGDSSSAEILLQGPGTDWVNIEMSPGSLAVTANGTSGEQTHTFSDWPGGRFSLSTVLSGSSLNLVLFYAGGDSSGSVTVGAGFGGNMAYTEAISRAGMAIAGLQVGPNPVGPNEMTAFAPSASLDPTIATINATPGLVRSVGWDVLREIAEAEMGAVWLSEAGVPTFRNRNSLRGIGEPVHPITSRTSLMDLSWREAVEQVRSQVTVPIMPTVNYLFEDYSTLVWSASDTDTLIAVDRIRVMNVWLSGVAIDIDASPLPSVDADRSRFQANTEPDGSGTNVTAEVSIAVELRGPRIARLTIRNDTGSRVYLVAATGSPYVYIRARQRIYQSDESEEIVTAVNEGVNAEPLDLPASPWIQNAATGNDLAQFLAAELGSPRPVLQRVPVWWDPRRQLGDIVEISDPDVTGLEPMRGVVIAIEQGGTAGSIDQYLDIRPLLPTLSEFNDAWDGQTIADVNALWDGMTIADLNADPLRVS